MIFIKRCVLSAHQLHAKVFLHRKIFEYIFVTIIEIVIIFIIAAL